jgi:aquaporin Z
VRVDPDREIQGGRAVIEGGRHGVPVTPTVGREREAVSADVPVIELEEDEVIDDIRKPFVEALGTALLVIFGCGVAALSFGFEFAAGSTSAGVVATAFAFGLLLLVLAYSLGPLSGCHVNPAVTIGFLVSRRFSVPQAVQYWVAQVIGGVVGAAVLWAMLAGTTDYDVDVQGLGANGFDQLSMTGINTIGAFVVEVVLTFLFVYVVLAVTGRIGTAPSLAISLDSRRT